MDSIRAKEIINSQENIQVLYQGTPVWIENVMDNNSAEITYLTNHERIEVPVYKLVENQSARP